jgi:alpha-beta hydrolase superfamily lysophospholipase
VQDVYSPYCGNGGIVPAGPLTSTRLTSPDLDHILAADGTRLSRRRWHTTTAARGTVLIVHGLGEHSGRYGHVADSLVARGWRVTAYDQRGHGTSDGVRGRIRRDDDLLTDLAAVLDAERAAFPGPLTLLGHSMGGLVAAQFVADAVRPVDALILTSPALDPRLTGWQRLQLRVASALAPDLAIGNGLRSRFLSHDPDVVRAYDADPLVHDRVTARLVRFIADGGAHVRSRAAVWQVPTLLLWAGDDRIVAPVGSAAFAARAPRAVVTAECFDALWHEILNEREAGPVFAVLERWLDTRFPATGG